MTPKSVRDIEQLLSTMGEAQLSACIRNASVLKMQRDSAEPTIDSNSGRSEDYDGLGVDGRETDNDGVSGSRAELCTIRHVPKTEEERDKCRAAATRLSIHREVKVKARKTARKPRRKVRR